MGVALLEACLRDGFPHQNRHLLSAPRSKPRRTPASNRSARRKPQQTSERSPSPESKPNSQISGRFRILKRGEELTPIKQSTTPISDQNTKRGGSVDRVAISPPLFYAGSASFTSPPPSSVPLPAFCTKNIGGDAESLTKSSAHDATFDLRRILRLESSGS